ncbi:hypothetical protein, variant [Sphaeroforma arctica JP610]|uniref:mRNA decay factor PAT1 domain-containing protein n=1 Tax=Sphaeroforma arctica JP610 TaxID=667725 RepID=A0A0L0FN38_9EUKA|nr:hypothetical protein, variant [Sphaeroforma arctica JP610]KNC78149.1 hypothetical protein, variant [Sphaeroforma arctica JP610]|eukprot:XP_014152051.1 hypothetical protein, variant [Sphaeroforma arctica JP610]
MQNLLGLYPIPKDLKEGDEDDCHGGALEESLDENALLHDKDELNDDTFGDDDPVSSATEQMGGLNMEPSQAFEGLLTPGDMLRQSEQLSGANTMTYGSGASQMSPVSSQSNNNNNPYPMQTQGQPMYPPGYGGNIPLPQSDGMAEQQLLADNANRPPNGSTYIGNPQYPGSPSHQQQPNQHQHQQPQQYQLPYQSQPQQSYQSHQQQPQQQQQQYQQQQHPYQQQHQQQQQGQYRQSQDQREMYAPPRNGEGPYMPPGMDMPPKQSQYDPYANLMTRSEKDFITRVQLAQIQSNNPHIDDFYFQAYTLKKSADADHGKKLKLYMAKHANKSTKYTPVAFENTLGKIPALSIHAPRPMIESVVRREEAGGPQFSRRKFLKAVESGYVAMLRMEDCDIEMNGVPESAKKAIVQKRKQFVDQVFETFALSPLVMQRDRSAQFDDEYFLRIIHIAKAQRLLARAIVFFDTNQSERTIAAILRNTLTLSQTTNGKPAFEGLHTDFIESVAIVISAAPAVSIITILKMLSVNSNDDITALAKSTLGAAILKLLLEKVNEKPGEGSQSEKPYTGKEVNALNAVADEVSQQLLQYPGMLVDGVGLGAEDKAVWDVIVQVATRSSADARNELLRHLRPETAPEAIIQAISAQ